MALAASHSLPSRANGLPGLIAKVKESVCPVGAYSVLDNPRFSFRGTGFAVGDGTLVATCWHVVAAVEASTAERPGSRAIAVQLPKADGSFTTHEAIVAAVDRSRDLALLRMREGKAAPLTLSTETTVVEGTDVALMGFPIGGVLGYRHVTHRGIVASHVASDLPTANARQLNEGSVARLRQGSFELLQLDATAYPGNSGGPLLDVESGRVVGVVNMVLLKGNRESALSQPTGITYAVPARYLVALLGQA